MKRFIRIYVKKRIWECRGKTFGPRPSDMDVLVEWVMQGYPFKWRTRLWAATHCYNRPPEYPYEWLIK